MDVEKRVELIKRPPTEEVITEEELRELLETKKHPVAYDGFEPSGIGHIGSGLLRAIKLQDLLDARIKFKLLIADWFAYINEKLGGNLNNIQKAGKYLIEVWKACGVDTDKVDIIWTSDLVNDSKYWKLVIDVAKATTIKRMRRCSTIMGRKKGEMQHTAQILYPAMQAADPFYLKVDICQLGKDQRGATILSREVGPKLGLWKPVCVHHHLLMGLKGPEKMGGSVRSKERDLEISSKMSKSVPKGCIFVHDSPKEIKEKILDAFCPEKQVIENPVLEICKYIIFRKVKTFEIDRPNKYGGKLEFQNFEELKESYKKGELHPLDLKKNVARELTKILEPVREYFERNERARKLYEDVKKFEVTR